MSSEMSRKQRVITIVLGLTALIALAIVAPKVMDSADGATPTVTRAAPSDRHHYQRPRVMKRKFNRGAYGNARGVRLPGNTFRLAKRYCIHHPGACPRSTPTKGQQRGGQCDGVWSVLKWTCERLETTNCLVVMLSQSWLGCEDQPEWVHDFRKVEVLCGGSTIIGFLARGEPHVVVGGATVCLYEGVYKTWLEDLL